MKTYILSLLSVLCLWSCKTEKKTEEVKTSTNKIAIKKQVEMKKVNFKSEGLNLVGNIYYPPNFQIGKQYPAIVCSGSWTTVKEQMAGLYAKKLAEQGFITLAFDFRNFGESEGQPKFYESPEKKKVDIKILLLT